MRTHATGQRRAPPRTRRRHAGPAAEPGARGRAALGRAEPARPDARTSSPSSRRPPAIVRRRGGRARLAVQRAIGRARRWRWRRQLEDAMSGLGHGRGGRSTARWPGAPATTSTPSARPTASCTTRPSTRTSATSSTDDELARVRGALRARAPTGRDDGRRDGGGRAATARARSPAQLHDAMEGLGTEEDQIFNALDRADAVRDRGDQGATYHGAQRPRLAGRPAGRPERRRPRPGRSRLIGVEAAGTFENPSSRR